MVHSIDTRNHSNLMKGSPVYAIRILDVAGAELFVTWQSFRCQAQRQADIWTKLYPEHRIIVDAPARACATCGD